MVSGLNPHLGSKVFLIIYPSLEQKEVKYFFEVLVSFVN